MPSPPRYLLVSAEENEPSAWTPALPVRRLPWRRARHLAWWLAGWPPIDRAAGRPALVHVLSPWVRVPTRAPVVYTVHDVMALQFPEWFPWRERDAYRRAYADIARRAVRIVAVSQRVAGDLVDLLDVERERIVVIHEAAGSEFSRTVDRAEQERVCGASGLRPDTYLLAVGAVSVRKNLGPVIRALAADSSLTLALAGPPGHGAAAVDEEIERLGVGGRVHRLGYVSTADLPVLVGSARALVHPATFEGFGLPPLEAMAAGTPVVVSAGGSLPEVVGDAGLLVPPADGTAWLDALRRVTGDSDLRASLARAGRDRARTFSWQRAAEETAAVHRACLADGST